MVYTDKEKYEALLLLDRLIVNLKMQLEPEPRVSVVHIDSLENDISEIHTYLDNQKYIGSIKDVHINYTRDTGEVVNRIVSRRLPCGMELREKGIIFKKYYERKNILNKLIKP